MCWGPKNVIVIHFEENYIYLIGSNTLLVANVVESNIL